MGTPASLFRPPSSFIANVLFITQYHRLNHPRRISVSPRQIMMSLRRCYPLNLVKARKQKTLRLRDQDRLPTLCCRTRTLVSATCNRPLGFFTTRKGNSSIINTSDDCRCQYPSHSLLKVRLSSASSSTSSATSSTDLRHVLLEEALQEVTRFGWTEQAVVAAAETIQQRHPGASMAFAGMVSPSDLIGHAMEQWNQQLKADLLLKKNSSESAPSDDSGASSSSAAAVVAEAFQVRLRYVADHVTNQAWHDAMATGARPENVWRTSQQLKEMVHIVSDYYADKTSSSPLTELEQLTLGGIYVSAELHMLSDTSADYQDTWAFLRHRCQDWEQLRNLKDSSGVDNMTAAARAVLPKGVPPASTLSDTWFVVSSVASSLLGGAASLLLNENTQALHKAWNNIVPSQEQVRAPVAASSFRQTSEEFSIPSVDGTHPSHYDSSSSVTASSSSSGIKQGEANKAQPS